MIRQAHITATIAPIDDNLISEVRAVIGAEAFAALAERFGGSRIFVPVSPADNHPLTVVLGREAVALLAGRFAGETIALPLTQRKHAAILADLRAGMGPTAVAKKYWCSVRNVHYIRQQAEARAAAERQLNLF